MTDGDLSERNWGGNYRYRARAIHAPATVEELRQVVAGAPSLRVLGSRHSFTGIGDAAELVTLDHLPRRIEVDREAMQVSVGAGVRYGDLAAELSRYGLALGNLASLPHISVAGAVSTATHGSGDANGNLATAVAALELVRSDGSVVSVARGDEDFEGLVVGLGAVGAVVRLVLEVEPEYEVRQWVFGRLTWEALLSHFEAIMASGYSVSVFSRWGEAVEQIWVKRRSEEPPGDELFGARAAVAPSHPILGLDPVHATVQLGAPGRWSDRLPHFRMGFTPSSGAEIHSEYLVARADARPAIEAILTVAPQLAPLVQVSEIRTVAADRLWLSPEYGRDSVGFHFTWKLDQPAVERALVALERVLEPFAFRPHWGKLFLASAETLGPRYPRWDAFLGLLERLDPRHGFRNAWLERHVLGGG